MHYVIIVAIIAVIVVFQTRIFKDTISKIQSFASIFTGKYKLKRDKLEKKIDNADVAELEKMLQIAGLDINNFVEKADNVNEYSEFEETEYFDMERARDALKQLLTDTNEICVEPVRVRGARQAQNPVFKEILSALNSYLDRNKGAVSDFHLMKDIVDRNCDAAEDEINTQIPVPLYLGLMGTMAGILVGIGYLWLSGDLTALLDAQSDKSATNGVPALLGGVALAMISSILGILLTTIGSMKSKNAKVTTERSKHEFLSWIQSNLLPNLNSDTVHTLQKMSQNLVAFNETFAGNTGKLDKTLSQVNKATVLQKQLLDAVSKIADKDVATQNIKVYKALKDSSQEIGTLALYLQNTTEYLNAVRDLTEKLDKDDRRSQAIERMLAFFENETSQIEQRRMAMSKAVGEIDSQLEGHLRKLSEHTAANIEKFNLALGKQQDALQQKLSETQVLMDELKNLSSIKSSIAKFEKATDEQNRKIDALTNAIHKIVEAKTQQVESPTSNAAGSIVHSKKGKWLALSIPFVFLLLLFAAILIIANWNNVSDFIKMFEF